MIFNTTNPNLYGLLISAGIASVTLGGCAKEGDFKLPGVYRINVQQGNVIEQEMLLKLKPGMDKNQVKFILGTPVLVDPFRSNRWEYVYTLSRGGQVRQQRHLTVYFEEGKLAYVAGDVVPGTVRDEVIAPASQARTVEVPLQKQKDKGFFRTLFTLLPFIDDEAKKPAATATGSSAVKATQNTPDSEQEQTRTPEAPR